MTTKSSRSERSEKRYFFRRNSVSSHGFFFVFFTLFCIGFTRIDKKYVKVTDDDAFNGQIEFKAKSEIMKSVRNYKKADKKRLRVLKCEEIVVLRDFLYKV